MASPRQFTRPRGGIKTVLDLTDRDGQDNFYFPPDSETSWFFRGSTAEALKRTQLLTTNFQEITQRGPAEWGQRMTFELNQLPTGDLLTSAVLQIQLGHWLPPQIISGLLTGTLVQQVNQNNWPYTYIESIGTSIIEYAEFEVGDQTLERISGEYIRSQLNIVNNQNQQFGLATDAFGAYPFPFPETPENPDPLPQVTTLSPQNPWPTENGIILCPLAFFFTKHLKSAFPLLSVSPNSVRIHIKLRPFTECVRSSQGWRKTCTASPLGSQIKLFNPQTLATTYYDIPSTVPPFRDCRLLMFTALTDGKIRQAYLRSPFEQMSTFLQSFRFTEPQKYVVAKTTRNDLVEIQLPLEFNHPVKEIFWFFRRNATEINNEWSNFKPNIETDSYQFYEGWLVNATLQVNGIEVVSGDGDYFRYQLARRHNGGIASWASNMYGYVFSRIPENFQPNGTANMSRANSIVLNLTVRVPQILPVYQQLFQPWGEDVIKGWEIGVFSHGLNWLRFENGLCQKLFNS
jgi:hypothetical protein